jgi:hypothetical protein
MSSALAALLLAMAWSPAAHAQQPSCPCDSSATRTPTVLALTQLLSNKMVCGSSGGDSWQEWHNGSSSGPVVDYKLGPGDPVDPSTTVGSFTINADNTVSYTYGSTSYKYAVCSTARSTYTFCGAAYGGRDLTDLMIGGNGLQSCVSVAAAIRIKTAR